MPSAPREERDRRGDEDRDDDDGGWQAPGQGSPEPQQGGRRRDPSDDQDFDDESDFDDELGFDDEDEFEDDELH